MRQTCRVAAWTALAIVAGSASTQESKPDSRKSDSARKTADDDVVNVALDKCVTMPPLDLSVLSDAHVYVQTRGRNHYLLTTGECRDLKQSYIRGEVQLVPYGGRVCQSDGSYFVYRTAGHEATCPILTIDRVTNRAAARALAESDQSRIKITKITPPE